MALTRGRTLSSSLIVVICYSTILASQSILGDRYEEGTVYGGGKDLSRTATISRPVRQANSTQQTATSRPRPCILLISFFSQGRLNPLVEARRGAIRRLSESRVNVVNKLLRIGVSGSDYLPVGPVIVAGK